jgi:hypothetical protein
MLENETSLLDEVGLAFSRVIRPQSHEIVNTTQDPIVILAMEHYKIPPDPDATSAIEHFSNVVQEDIDDVVLIAGCSCEDLYVMTPLAIEYYLPAYLRYVINDRAYWDYGVITGLISFLQAGENVTWPEFSLRQIRCLIAVLEFILRNRHRYELIEEDIECVNLALKRWQLCLD